MKKRKTYEVSLINRTSSKLLSDRTKFYTSDTALELVFKLKEVEYDFDSAELILLNDEDRSLTTRPVKKTAEGFTYDLEDDIVEHYGTWSGQLKFTEGSEIYVSTPVGFRIHNDLYNDRPPRMTDVNTWKNLRKIADSLIADIRSELETFNEKVLEIETAESTRQQAESSRMSAEAQRETDHANRSAELAGKANKKQEDWITPTLLDGWVGSGNGHITARYMKDEFGFVHLRGILMGGTAYTPAFVLPSGYRPSSVAGAKFIQPCYGTYTGPVEVRGNGQVIPVQYTTWIKLDGIIFEAVQ